MLFVARLGSKLFPLLLLIRMDRKQNNSFLLLATSLPFLENFSKVGLTSLNSKQKAFESFYLDFIDLGREMPEIVSGMPNIFSG
jgi:hypothetical protein